MGGDMLVLFYIRLLRKTSLRKWYWNRALKEMENWTLPISGGKLLKATANVNTLKVLDIIKEEVVAQWGYQREIRAMSIKEWGQRYYEPVQITGRL